jgi:hypothetical protein
MINLNNYDVSDGETQRMDCPVCRGKNTFSITNNMGDLVWNCYKVSCTVSGSTRVGMSIDDIKARFKKIETVDDIEFELPEYVVSRSGGLYMNRWCDRWGLNADKLGLMYDVKEDRVVFPVVHDGKIVDATGRSLGKRIPKWKRYGNSGLPYVHGCGKVAVVVEDCVSAAVVGDWSSYVGVALLGTSLQDSHRSYLSQFSTALIALDPDALTKSLQMAKELRGYVSDVRPVKLEDDIKYCNPTDMEKLNGIITN